MEFSRTVLRRVQIPFNHRNYSPDPPEYIRLHCRIGKSALSRHVGLQPHCASLPFITSYGGSRATLGRRD
ncbi:hypothetical protein XENTR_v10023991 [Xenopus tropicalis]|nr:hypothetical protein XENTR_v10023991 [Xenopus tropicalis]